MQTQDPFRSQRAVEQPLDRFAVDAPYRLALAYANTYHVGMSSLGFLRVYELIHRYPEWSCERFFSNGTGVPRSVERATPLDAFGCIAFSVSFEEDFVSLVEMLQRARIPPRRDDRTEHHPLIVMGGSCASINPLPMADFVDVFALGAGENVLEPLLTALAQEGSTAGVLERLASTEGFFIPRHHDHEHEPGLPKLRKLELTGEQMALPGAVPSSSILTPHTEFADKHLIEMSRGCPEKCKYCWATFGMGKFRFHPTEHILAALDRARGVTDRVGFLATAVGDHPEIATILRSSYELGFRASVSSIRIPAVTDEVLEPLRQSGARSITLAPETGSDRLRFVMNKPITNATLLDKVDLIFGAGFSQLKLYFIIGMPDERADDIQAILDLARECRERGRTAARKLGVMPSIQLGCNILIPKPYTPWQREAMADLSSLKKKIRVLKRGVAQLPNVTMTMMSPREAVWQTYISRAGSSASAAILDRANGQPLTQILRSYKSQVQPEVFATFPRQLRWQFLRLG